VAADAGGGVIALPYRFCDDGVPPTGGREPNVGAVRAVPVPQKYDGHVGLPAKVDPDPDSGADDNGDIALDVNVSLPDPQSHPPPRDGYPLLVFMHGCCGGNKTGWEASSVDAAGERWHYNNAWFAARGYVVLTYTARGFVDGEGRGSTGETQLNARQYEINDFQYLAGLLADDPFFQVNPRRVVATGGSYGGGFSWLALTDPEWRSPGGTRMQLAAVAPRYGWTDLVESLVPAGRHDRDALPAFDGTDSLDPMGFPKRSIVAGLYASGTTGVPPGGNHATFPAWVDEAMVCLSSAGPFESNPLCEDTVRHTLPAIMEERSAYYQNDFFDRLAAGKVRPVPVYSAGALTDPLFPAVEHRRMAERLRSVDPRYPVQEYYGDYQHFVQNKAKEWGDVCGEGRRVCGLADYPDGDLNAEPEGLRHTGVTTRLNRFVDFYAKPPGAGEVARPRFDVTASLQVCPDNASDEWPADEPGERFTAGSFDDLAPHELTIAMTGRQVTTSAAAPNLHAVSSDPIVNEVSNGRHCPVETTPAGPGVATYTSDELADSVTMIGRTRVTVAHTGIGSGVQLGARLYDVFPDGRRVLVDRGVRRVADPNATTVFDLHGNGWRFPAGHRIAIEQIEHLHGELKVRMAGNGIELVARVERKTATWTVGAAAHAIFEPDACTLIAQ
jgi:dienelactone hydrolase